MKKPEDGKALVLKKPVVALKLNNVRSAGPRLNVMGTNILVEPSAAPMFSELAGPRILISGMSSVRTVAALIGDKIPRSPLEPMCKSDNVIPL